MEVSTKVFCRKSGRAGIATAEHYTAGVIFVKFGARVKRLNRSECDVYTNAETLEEFHARITQEKALAEAKRGGKPKIKIEL